jgi:hypothetical protein
MLTRLLLIATLAACGPKSTTSTPPPPPARSGSSTTEAAICGTRGAAACPADQFCSYQPGDECGASDKPGHCMGKPAACPRIARPVCGCDGKTYGNECEAAAAATGVKSAGACN